MYGSVIYVPVQTFIRSCSVSCVPDTRKNTVIAEGVIVRPLC